MRRGWRMGAARVEDGCGAARWCVCHLMCPARTPLPPTCCKEMAPVRCTSQERKCSTTASRLTCSDSVKRSVSRLASSRRLSTSKFCPSPSGAVCATAALAPA